MTIRGGTPQPPEGGLYCIRMPCSPLAQKAPRLGGRSPAWSALTIMLHERSLDPAMIVTRGYWKLGAVDYTDHDYGTED